jgi:hypothetical protein
MKRISWMHPSYRDLVIEELIEDRELRLLFLSTTGLEGIKLALSVRSEENDEKFPSLVTEETSKSAINARILDIAEKAFEYQTKLLLEILIDAINELDKKQIWLLETLMDVIHIINKKWGNGKLSVSTLELFCEASELIQPLPPLPNFEPTWHSLKNEILIQFDEDKLLEPYSIQEWIDLIELIMKNEPRFLRQVGFPPKYLELAKLILDHLEMELTSELLDSTLDETRDEAERIYNLSEIASILSNLFGEFRNQFQKMSLLLREKYEEILNEIGPENDYDQENDYVSFYEDRDFDIETLFLDL